MSSPTRTPSRPTRPDAAGRTAVARRARVTTDSRRRRVGPSARRPMSPCAQSARAAELAARHRVSQRSGERARVSLQANARPARATASRSRAQSPTSHRGRAALAGPAVISVDTKKRTRRRLQEAGREWRRQASRRGAGPRLPTRTGRRSPMALRSRQQCRWVSVGITHDTRSRSNIAAGGGSAAPVPEPPADHRRRGGPTASRRLWSELKSGREPAPMATCPRTSK